MAAGGAGAVRVRGAARGDMPAVRRMIQELAEYEGVPDGPTLSADDLVADGFDASPAWFFVLVAESAGPGGEAGEAGEAGGELVGYALCNRAYSSWTRRALYVEDLFVRPAARRRGVGRQLMQRICQLGAAWGATRVDWHVLESNAPARAFYERLGALDLRRAEGRLALRLPHDKLRALAAEPSP